MKKFISIILILALSIIVIPTYAATEIKVCVNGEYVSFDVPPQIINDRTMVPIRAIIEKFGGSARWIEQEKKAVLELGDDKLALVVNSKTAFLNNKSMSLDVEPQIRDGRILIPARYVAESFGFDVAWDNNKKIVYINGETYSSSSNSYSVPEYITETNNITTSPIVSEQTTNIQDNSTSISSSSYTNSINYYWDAKSPFPTYDSITNASYIDTIIKDNTMIKRYTADSK